MRAAGAVVAQALTAAACAAQPGVSTREVDQAAAKVIAANGAKPSFLGYHGYPASTCISVNAEVIHGIPGDRVLRTGDLVSVDVGAIISGWHGDAAVSFLVPQSPVPEGQTPLVAAGLFTPPVPGSARRGGSEGLIDRTKEALWAGIAKAVVGARLSDIGAAVEQSLADTSYGIVTDFVGHGIGTQMHMPPDVPNVGPAGKGPRLRAGMVLAIEPMIMQRHSGVTVLADDWTVVTDSGDLAAHWEHTVAITPTGPRILTLPPQE
ncbi:M24 family metallopeptidase [Candidatus Nanopelagicales bacterium]|nr:M24 family metallopeptidase [Candidatus Nanopelagicales bacterium]